MTINFIYFDESHHKLSCNNELLLYLAFFDWEEMLPINGAKCESHTSSRAPLFPFLLICMHKL